MKLNPKTLIILIALLGGVAAVSTSTWGVISIADRRYASTDDLQRTKLVLEEHILESNQSRLNAQLTALLLKLVDKPGNVWLIQRQNEITRALAPIDAKLEDVRQRQRDM